MPQISKCAKIILKETVEKVFPLFSAKGEMKWVQNWEPNFIYPKSGDFIENLCFITKSNNQDEKEFNWINSYLDINNHITVYTVFTENRVWTVKVICTAISKNRTEAEITYTYTALNKKGISLNEISLTELFASNLKDWEEAINYYLINKEKIN